MTFSAVLLSRARTLWSRAARSGVLSDRSCRTLLALSTVIGLAMCFSPLVSVHGVESALCLGLLLPPLAAAAGATLALRGRRSTPPSTLRLIGRATAAAGLMLAIPVALLGLNAVRVPNCAPLEGLLFIALGPGMGVMLAALWGTVLGSLRVAPRAAVLLALSMPLASIGIWLWRLYSGPGVFAYGHFFGYFPGTLYDEFAPLPRPLLTLRALSVCWGLSALGLLFGHRQRDGALRLRARAGPALWTVLAVLGAGAGLIGELRAPQLGHQASVSYIEQELGATHQSARCRFVYPRGLLLSRVRRYALDCDVRVALLERWFGISDTPRVQVYLFRSAAQKRRLMGAAGTNIAKPWLGELYIQDAAFPHPVLPHELAHVVAAGFGRGPFAVSGGAFGLWPNPALIEGLAVAASWAQSSRFGMTPHQWSRAMLELEMVPPLARLFGAGFLGQQRRLAYTLSGSVVRFIAERYGADRLRAIYRAGDVAGPLGISLDELERSWRDHVAAVPLPESARALAALRFSGESILSEVCPHQKAELRRELGGMLSSGQDVAAERTCRRLLEVDPTEVQTRATLVAVLARQGKDADAADQLARLAQPPIAPAPVIARAREALADEAWRRGDRVSAARIYRELLSGPLDRNRARQLQVKALSLEGSLRQAHLLFELMVGEPGAPAGGAFAVHLARELRVERVDGLPAYLEARQLWFRERFLPAAELLREARDEGLPTRLLELEALRVEAICRYAGGEPNAARALWRELLAIPDAGAALHAEARDWLDFARQALATPAMADGH